MDINVINAKNIKTIWEQDTNRELFKGQMFFPNKKQLGLKFEYIKGKQGVPVALVSAKFDTNVLYRDRIGVDYVSGKLPFFKEAYKIDEETRQMLLRTKEEFGQSLLDNVFDDVNELLAGAEVSAERMRCQLLSQGTISIVENGVNKQYDYGFDQAKQFSTETTKWDNSSAKPLESLYKQILAYKKVFKKTAKYVVMSSELFSTHLATDPQVITYFANLSTPNLFPNEMEIQQFIENKLNVKFIIFDAEYKVARDFDGEAVPFYPTDRYTILSTIDLGDTLYGTTPEEADLLGGQSTATSCEVLANGVAITTWKETDPVNVNVKVSQVCAPTCANIDTIMVVKVLA